MELVGSLVVCFVGYLVTDSCCHGPVNVVYCADGHFHAVLHYAVALLACISTFAQTLKNHKYFKPQKWHDSSRIQTNVN